MKKIIHALGVVFIIIGIGSCKGEEIYINTEHNTERNIKLSLYLSHNDTLSHGGAFMNGDAIIIELKTNGSNVHFDRVVFFWDDKEIADIDSPPFRTIYKIENQTEGEHKIKYAAYYSYAGIGVNEPGVNETDSVSGNSPITISKGSTGGEGCISVCT